MIYVNENIVLTDEERKSLSLVTWNDSIDSECDAHEFVQSMKENIVWANTEILNIQKVECVFHATWTLSPGQTGQSERSDAGVVFYS